VRGSHSGRRLAPALALVLIVGRAGPDPAPFQEPVSSASSSTDWVAEEPPRFGASGERLTPEAILELLAQQELGTLPGAEISRQLDTAEGGTVTGYLRATLPPSDHPLRARDTRVRMEVMNEGWQVSAVDRRYHCATEQPSTDFCQ
jgi:hypothetical protein